MKVSEIGSAVKVKGVILEAFINGFGTFEEKAINLLENKGIKNIKEDGWYSAREFLEVLNDTKDSTLKVVGMKVPENAEVPNIDSVESALGLIDKAYQMNHRGGAIGSYEFTKTGDKKGKMVCNNPYPCEFDQALIKSFMKKFQETGLISVPSVRHAEGGCRKKGADSCTYNIRW
ncbi:MAG: hypothetical protein BAJALOKI2v1_20063 [Promethearchaeota archaeon]|nr:MAG: hypothetical protein BAJALOKI2v1_20063 [Candidatus Lokiarchaeota archaeon]